ncbi:hypothetical protein MMC21_007466 [Puttea exsequens]|nr:hypothetical protein [Puttea exsequens]
MHFSVLAPLTCAILPLSIAVDPTRLIYEFPEGTWLENLVVRPCGSILLTLITTPDLYLINPLANDPKPELIHHFPSSLWLTGITETEPDTYYLIAANATYKTLTPTPGSNHIYKVRFPKPQSAPEISLTATIEPPVLLNGLIPLNPTTLLASDSTTGAVWAVDITTGASHIVIQDPLMAPTSVLPVKLGINGIKLFRNHTLYFTNSAQQLFASISINADGTPVAPAKKIASAANGTFYDDFALDRHGIAFAATVAGDSIAEIGWGGRTRIIAGVVNTTELAQPTSARFGRTRADRRVLYVTTAGGLAFPIDGTEVVGGQLVAVDTAGGGW